MVSILFAAGWPILPLLACSVIAMAIVFDRLYSLQRRRVMPGRLLDDLVTLTRNGTPGAEVINALAADSVLGTVLATGLRATVIDPRIREETLHGHFESAGRAAVHRMERYLTTLGTVASAAPLLGLMGTVIGMIEIFGSQTAGGNNPAMLAHGISVALYNTAFGLMVAIPSLMFYRYFRGQIDTYTLELEQAADRAVRHLMRSGPALGPGPRAVPPSSP